MNQLSKSMPALFVIFLPSVLSATTVHSFVNQNVNGGKRNKIGEWEWQAKIYSCVVGKNTGTSGYVVTQGGER